MVYQLVSNGDVPDEDYFNALMQQSMVPCTSGTRPSSPTTGQPIYETDTKLIRVYDGSTWYCPASPDYTTFATTFYSNNVSGTAIGGGSVSITYSRYQVVNKKCHYVGHAQINTTTASGFGFNLPVAASVRSFSMSHILLQGPSSYTTATGQGHVPNIAAPYIRVGPVSNSNAQLNIVASGDTVHWNILYETV